MGIKDTAKHLFDRAAFNEAIQEFLSRKKEGSWQIIFKDQKEDISIIFHHRNQPDFHPKRVGEENGG